MEQEMAKPTSPLRPKVLDLDAVSLGVRTARDSHDNSPTARWKQPTLRPDEIYKPGILDIDSFKSQAQSNIFPLTGFVSVESGIGGSMTQARPQATQTNILHSQAASQVQFPPHPQFYPQSQTYFQPSPTERMRTQLPPPLQPQVLHQTQPMSNAYATEKPRPQPHSLIDTSDWAFGAQQSISALPPDQTSVWAHSETELTVDEPLWVSPMEGSRRPISTRPGGFEQQFLRPEDRGLSNILAPSSTSSMGPIFTPVQYSTLAPPIVQIQTPMMTAQPNLGPSAAPILAPERCWTSVPLNVGSIGDSVSSPPTPLSRKETSRPRSQASALSVSDPIWTPNWELASQGQRENRTSHRDKVQQKRSRSMCRRSAPTESSADGPVAHVRTRRSRSAHKERDGERSELIKQSVGGKEENKDTDNLVQETDSQYGTWETGLHTDDSLTPATPSSEGNLTPSPRKSTPPHTADQPLLIDTPDGSTTSPQKQTELLFPETSTALLDTSVLRGRVRLNQKSTRRAPPSRAARHSALLTQVPEGPRDDEWRFRDSTEEKADSFKEAEESDSEEQAKGIETRTSSMSQPQRVALFPGMDPSALKAQLKKRGDSDNQTDGPSPSQLSRSPKSPFLPRAAPRVLPPAGGKENGEESSPQWLKELKTKKRLSQYEPDSTA